MAFSNEADRAVAFKRVYGDQPELSPVQEGLFNHEYHLVNFDPESGYAHFRERENWGTRRYVEFLRRSRPPFIVVRNRFYIEQNPGRVFSASIRFQMKDHGVSWSFMFDENADLDAPPPVVDLEFRTGDFRNSARFAKFAFRGGEVVPEWIKIGYGDRTDLDQQFETVPARERFDPKNEVYLRRAKQEAELRYWVSDKRDRSIFRPSLAKIGLREPFTEPSGEERFVLDNKGEGLLVAKKHLVKGDFWMFTLPRPDAGRINSAIRGSWNELAEFPDRFPAIFSERNGVLVG